MDINRCVYEFFIRFVMRYLNGRHVMVPIKCGKHLPQSQDGDDIDCEGDPDPLRGGKARVPPSPLPDVREDGGGEEDEGPQGEVDDPVLADAGLGAPARGEVEQGREQVDAPHERENRRRVPELADGLGALDAQKV